MSRRITFISLGSLAGALVASWAWHEGQSELAAGVSAAGVGFGLAHVLFLISLPWSLSVWALAIACMLITGVDGAGGLAPFYAMPVVAGAGWGWLASFIPDKRRRAQRSDPPAI
jgi:hypothetical protein